MISMVNDFPMTLATVASFMIIASSIMFQNYGTLLTNAGSFGIKANETSNNIFTQQNVILSQTSIMFAIFGMFLFFMGIIFLYYSIKLGIYENGKIKAVEKARYKNLIKHIFIVILLFSVIFFVFLLIKSVPPDVFSSFMAPFGKIIDP